MTRNSSSLRPPPLGEVGQESDRRGALTRKMVEWAFYIDIEKRIFDEIPALIGEFSYPSARCVSNAKV